MLYPCNDADLNCYVHDNEPSVPPWSAYCPLHSTETALLHVKNDSIDDRKAVALILLELSTAFDTGDHNIQLRRLEQSWSKLVSLLSI